MNKDNFLFWTLVIVFYLFNSIFCEFLLELGFVIGVRDIVVKVKMKLGIFLCRFLFVVIDYRRKFRIFKNSC